MALFQPGQSGNPAGRPKGARSKLSEDFLSALHEDFKAHGKAAITKTREEKPDQYLKVIASLVPKDFNLNINSFEDLSDADLRSELRDILSALGSFIAETGEGDPVGDRAPSTH